MNIVLIRHADRVRDVPEASAALTTAGKEMATAIALRLKQLDAPDPATGKAVIRLPEFTSILTSSHAAPLETAKLISGPAKDIIKQLPCLTPPRLQDGDLLPADLFREAGNQGAVLGDASTVAIVGHEPVISRLLCLMTGKNSRSLDRGEAVWITGSGKKDFTDGKTMLVYATRHSDFADDLREKIQTKMTVCTFLAGFTIAALIEIIKDPDKIIRTSRVTAAISFTAALGLFVAAIYIYDELSMPRPFWHAGIAGGESSSRTAFGHDLRLNGALYAHMVRAWRVFFTPAVVFSLTGFFALVLFNLRYPHLIMPERRAIAALIGGCVSCVVIAVLMYRRFRPKLAID